MQSKQKNIENRLVANTNSCFAYRKNNPPSGVDRAGVFFFKIGVQMGSSVADYIEHKKTGTNLIDRKAVCIMHQWGLCEKPQPLTRKGTVL